MEVNSEINPEETFYKTKNNLGETFTTNYITRNFPKSSMIKMTNSSSNPNINNNGSQKILSYDNKNYSINNQNSSNSFYQLNLKNSIDSISQENKKDESISKNKRKLTKIQVNKKKQRKLQKMQSEYYAKYPKTIFQKIIRNIDRVKIKADKTLDIMKKNLKISGQEIAKRLNYQKQSKLIATNILNYERQEKKRKNLLDFDRSKRYNNSQQSFYIGKYKNKNISNIFPNISSSNINQSINGSILMNLNNQNEASDINALDMNNTSSNININNGVKTGIRSLSQLSINKYSSEKGISLKEDLNLLEIPRTSLISIKQESPYKPLYPLDKNKNYYKNMFHYRNLDFPLKTVRAHCYKIYGIPAILVEQNSFQKDSEMNNLSIINKIELIQDNIEYFKINFMYKNDFLEAFNNMENIQKAEFNYNIEEICCIMIKIIPIILQNYYEILKKLLGVAIPDIDAEREKNPENEQECLNLNYTFFNSVSEYFNTCLEVYRVLNKKCNRFTYSINEFAPLNSYLDLTRYNTTNLISFANSFINKTKKDMKILEKLEVGLNLKKIKKQEIDIFERYHQRHRKKTSDEDVKIERINRALNLKSRINRPQYRDPKIFIEKVKIIKKTSPFNSPVFRDMMKYFKPNIKAKIIAQQVVDRYEEKKRKYGNLNESENQED